MTHTALEQELFTRLKTKALIRKNNSNQKASTTIRSPRGHRQNWLFDLRALLTQSDDLNLITEVFWERMAPHWPFQVGGLEVGAIPLVAGIVMKGREKGFNLNSFIVRKSRKKSGLCKQIEGEVTDLPIVVVDDLINSGRSLARVQIALEQINKNINTVFSYISFEREHVAQAISNLGARAENVFLLSEFDLKIPPATPLAPTQDTLDIKWVFRPPAPNYVFSVPHSAPVHDGDFLYYGADNGWFYCLEAQTGTQKWSFQTGESIKGIFSSPVLTPKGVIFGAYDGSIYHLNRQDGSVIWEAPIAEYVGSSPCLAPNLDLVFIGLEHNIRQNQGSIVALNLHTGQKVWEQFTKDYMHSTPAYWAEERLVTVGCNDGKVLLLDANSGTLYWEFKMEGPLKAAPTFDPKRRQVIAPSFDKNCYGIDIDTGQEKWRFSAGHAFYNTALIVQDRLYVGSCDKYFYIYDLAKNTLLKKMHVLGRVLSHPQLINGHVWFGANDGGIRQIDLDGHYKGGRLLPERPVTPIIYDQKSDNYFVVTMGNYLLCMKPLLPK